MEAAVRNVTEGRLLLSASGFRVGCLALLISGRDWEVEWVEVVSPVGKGGCFRLQQMALTRVAPMLVEKRQ